MKKRTVAVSAALLAVCVWLSACGNESGEITLPADTSSIENYIESTTGTALAEEASETTTEISETVTETTIPWEELSDHDKAVRAAAEFVEEHPNGRYILYDLDLDGIPELMAKTRFMDTEGWEVYKLTGNEALELGYMEFANSPESFSDLKYYHGDELTLESGVHIYRDAEKDEIFYVTEYVTELHTEGFASGIRYDIYADKLAETELYHCDFFTYDDCGASGNRYISHNILNGEQASPMYRMDCNAEGFLYCNEFGEYLSSFEYLGMIDTENCYTSETFDSFYDYAATVVIPEKTKDERTYVDNREKITVCGNEYYADTYEARVRITNDNFNDIDLSELKFLPKLEKLTIDNDSDYIVDLAPLGEVGTITELMLYSDYKSEGDFDRSSLINMDNIIITNADFDYASKMKSVRFIDSAPKLDDPDGYAPLYDLPQLEAVRYNYYQYENGQIDTLQEHRPDLLLIYMP